MRLWYKYFRSEADLNLVRKPNSNLNFGALSIYLPLRDHPSPNGEEPKPSWKQNVAWLQRVTLNIRRSGLFPFVLSKRLLGAKMKEGTAGGLVRTNPPSLLWAMPDLNYEGFISA